MSRPWRVANTRDEEADGPLTRALEAEGLVAVACPVLRAVEASPGPRVREAVARLVEFDWLVVSSARSVRALQAAGLARWPAGLRSAAVGAATAAALVELGADPPPLVGAGDGAEALWSALRDREDWRAARVLVTTTAGGKTVLQDRLREAGAHVDDVETYRMEARSADAIRADWTSASADAVVLTSPRSVQALGDAIGLDALARLAAVVAIGGSTAEALRALGLDPHVAGRADLAVAARLVATLAHEAVRR